MWGSSESWFWVSGRGSRDERASHAGAGIIVSQGAVATFESVVPRPRSRDRTWRSPGHRGRRVRDHSGGVELLTSNQKLGPVLRAFPAIAPSRSPSQMTPQWSRGRTPWL
jgi:hypothetical protein